MVSEARLICRFLAFLLVVSKQYNSSMGESDEVDVLSGVRQGSVLGPCLFFVYFNNIPLGLKSKVSLFADNIIMYMFIGGEVYVSTLQQDLSM